jgi:hypothetical protein
MENGVKKIDFTGKIQYNKINMPCSGGNTDKEIEGTQT